MAIEGVGLIDPVGQWTDANGVPLAGGSVAFYVPQTVILIAVFADPALSVPLPNPVPLNASGRTSTSSTGLTSPVYLQQTAYDYLVQDRNGTTQIGPVTVAGSAWPGQVQGQAVLSPVPNANGIANRFTTTINRAASGVHSQFIGTRFDAPVIGAGVATVTEADTVYIDGPPTVGGTTYALKVGSGKTLLGGDVAVTGNANITGNLNVGGAATITGATLGGTFTGLLTTNPVVPAPAPNATDWGHTINEQMSTAASGTHPLLAGTAFGQPTVTPGGAAVSVAATVAITAPPTIGAQNYALLVQTGQTSLGGSLAVTGNATVSGASTSGSLSVTGNAAITGQLNSGIIVEAGSAPIPAVGSNAVGNQLNPTVPTAGSGTHAFLIGTYFGTPTIPLNGAAVTNAMTVFIAGQPAVPGAANYALNVNGATYLGGAVIAPAAFPWVNVPMNPANYGVNSAGSATVWTGGHPYVYRYTIIGKTMHLQCSAKFTINNGTTNELRFTIPGGGALPYDPLSAPDEDQARTAAFFTGGAGPVLAAAYINVSGGFISFQRADGAGFASGDVMYTGFMITVPLA